MRKLAYIANYRFPSERAHSVHVFHMCNAFSKQYEKVDLFVNKRDKSTEEDISRFYKADINFTVKRLSHGFFLPRFRPSFYINEFIFFSIFLISAGKYDIYYSRNEWLIYFLSFCLSREKLIWESHEAKLNFPASKILKKKIKTVVISEGIRDVYLNHGVKEENLFVAHDAIDESFLNSVGSKNDAREQLGIEKDEKVVMYIGGLDKWKGVDTYFEASQVCDSATFYVIGGNEEDISKYQKKYPLVKFLGKRPYRDLPLNQQAADILIVPNTAKNKLSESYTSPLKLFAHMTSGVPLVTSRIKSIENVVSESDVSFFTADDPTSLCEVIQNVFTDYADASHKAGLVKQRATKYTWTNRAKTIANFIS